MLRELNYKRVSIGKLRGEEGEKRRGLTASLARQSDWIISTKLYNGYGREEPNRFVPLSSSSSFCMSGSSQSFPFVVYSRGLSRKHILAGAEDCLARLGLDYVDVIFCHCFDPEVEMVSPPSFLQASEGVIDASTFGRRRSSEDSVS